MRLITQSKFIMKLGYQRKLENALQYCPDELSEKLHYLTTLRATVSEFALALAGNFEIVKTVQSIERRKGKLHSMQQFKLDFSTSMNH